MKPRMPMVLALLATLASTPYVQSADDKSKEMAKALADYAAATNRGAEKLAEALTELGKFKHPKIEGILIKELANRFPEVRCAAAEGLGTQNSENAAKSVLGAAHKEKEFWVFESMGKGLRKMDDPKAGAWIIKNALKHGSRNIRYIACRGLGGTKAEGAAEALAVQLKKERDWEVRAYGAESLGLLNDESQIETLATLTKDKDWRVRLLTAKGLAAMAFRKDHAEKVIDPLLVALGDQTWQVREEAARGLILIKNDKVIGPLIAAMVKERGRIRKIIYDGLVELTGQSFEMTEEGMEQWQKWWQKNEADFKIEKVKGMTRPVSYYGIETYSNRIVFVVDRSGSMGDELPIAVREVKKAVAKLDDRGYMNVIFYSESVVPWKDEMMQATEENKKEMFKFMDKQGSSGGTNILGALEGSLEFAHEEGQDKGDAAVDTIFFLSDGRPTAGRTSDTEIIVKEITQRNRFQNIDIYTVGIGGEHDPLFMEKLAKLNNGEYVAK